MTYKDTIMAPKRRFDKISPQNMLLNSIDFASTDFKHLMSPKTRLNNKMFSPLNQRAPTAAFISI